MASKRTLLLRFLVLTLLLLGVSACNRRGSTSTATTVPAPAEETTVPPTQPPPTSPPVATETPTPTPTATATPEPVVLLPAPLYFLSDGQIQRLETDGRTLTQLTQEQAPIRDFDVSPVDAHLVYVSGNSLIEADPQYGTRVVKVERAPVAADNSEAYITQRISDPHFSPDGSQIAFGLDGVNRIESGEHTDFTTLLPSDLYPDPNNPPRSSVRFFTPGVWSPNGERLLVRFSYWPEAGGLAVLDLTDNSLVDLTSDDPNAVLCCDWAWSRDGETGFIASDLLAYGTPGLARVDAASGTVNTLVRGVPLGEMGADNPLRLFRSPYPASEGTLLAFASVQEDMDQPTRYRMQQVDPESGELLALREEDYETPGDILWARDGSGAVLVDRRSSGPTAPAAGPLVWLAVDGSPAPELPATGDHLHWGPPAAESAATAGENLDQEQEGQENQADEAGAAQAEGAQLTAQVLLNVRSGPDVAYPIVGELAAGESASIVGVSPNGEWWQIVYPPASDERAWVSGDPEFATAENAADVAIVTPPPPPAPTGRIYYAAPGTDGLISIFVQPLTSGATPALVIANASQPSLHQASGRLALRSTRSDLLGIGIFDLTQERLTGLTSHVEDSLPRWNPAGDRLVFASTRHGDRRWRVYTVPVGGAATAQDIAFGLDPDWHPTADRIAYKGCDERGEHCGIWTMDSSGGERRPLTENKTDARPVWTPSGRQIVFMSESRHDNWDIYSVDSWGNVTRLTNSPANDGLPTVSPDGSWVGFVSHRGGQWGVWIVPIQGGPARRVITIGPDLPNWLEQGIDWD